MLLDQYQQDGKDPLNYEDTSNILLWQKVYREAREKKGKNILTT